MVDECLIDSCPITVSGTLHPSVGSVEITGSR